MKVMPLIYANPPEGRKVGVYILKGTTKKGKISYYIGMTKHLTKRLEQHRNKMVKSTRKYKHILCIAFRPTKTATEARKLEYYWKKTIQVPKKAKQMLEKQLQEQPTVEDWISNQGWKIQKNLID